MAQLERYRVLSRIAQGGQGEILKAEDVSSGAVVALKLRRTPDAPARQAASREAELLLHLKPYPGLPVVREAFGSDEQSVLATSWIEGSDLARVLEVDGDPGLPFADVLGHLEQAAAAVDHLHSHDPPIVHGDVKPANLILTPAGRVVLVDLGSATRRPEDIGVGRTPGFVAPELGAGQPATPAADVYALAATAYALLTGIPPRLGMRTRWEHLSAPEAARSERALRRGLSIDPGRRPAGASDLVAAFRSSAPGAGAPSNLPTPVDPMLGRTADLREVRTAARSSRLLTITGRGGVGKTRLALEACRGLRRRHPDGVWWVDLAAASRSGLAEAVLAATGGSQRPGTDPLDALEAGLADGRTLLLLDNCEDVADALAALVGRLLRACPRLQIVATSRIPLDVPGERLHRLGPLPVAGGGSAAALDLFWQRAGAPKGSPQRRGDSARAAAEICRLLDGLPLALELAAARAQATPVTELAEQLKLREATPELDTATETVDWSVSFLGAEERALAGRITTFAGGADLEALRFVCAPEREEGTELQSRLWRLAGLALVEVEHADGRTRYLLHETVRSVLAAGLPDQERLLLDARLLRWCVDLTEEARKGLRTPEGSRHARALEREHPNLLRAIEIASEGGEGEALCRLAGALWFPWIRAGRLSECERLLDAALAREGSDHPAVLHGAGVLATHNGAWEQARSNLQRAVTLYESAGDRAAAVEARGDLLRPLQTSGDHAGYRAAVDLNAAEASELGDERLQAASAAEQGRLAFDEDRPEDARALFGRAVELNRKLGDRVRLHLALRGEALVAMQQVRFEDAVRDLTEAAAIELELGDLLTYATSKMEMGFIACHSERTGEARPLLEEARRAFRKMNHLLGQGTALHGLAQCALREGNFSDADRLLARSLDLSRQAGVPSSIASILKDLAFVDRRRGHRRRSARRLLEVYELYATNATEHDTVTLLEQVAEIAVDDRAAEAAELLGYVHQWNLDHDLPADENELHRGVREAAGDAYEQFMRRGAALDFRRAGEAGERLLRDIAAGRTRPR